MIAALGESYRPIAPDIRGHGGTAAVEPVALEAVISDLERIDAPSFTLVGYSMGGRIALHFALTHPERVHRLVLIGASPGIAEPAQREARRRADERLAAEIEGEAIEEFALRWARTPVLAGQPPEVLTRAHADRLRNTTAGLARALRGLGTGTLAPVWDRLAELAMPVELVVGERDKKFAVIARQMADSMPGARLRVVPGAGHAVHLEAPKTVASLITDA